MMEWWDNLGIGDRTRTITGTDCNLPEPSAAFRNLREVAGRASNSSRENDFTWQWKIFFSKKGRVRPGSLAQRVHVESATRVWISPAIRRGLRHKILKAVRPRRAEPVSRRRCQQGDAVRPRSAARGRMMCFPGQVDDREPRGCEPGRGLRS